MNVNSSTSTLTFTAPLLHGDVFTGTVVAMVNAISRYGEGPASEPETAVVTGMYAVTYLLESVKGRKIY